MDYAAYICNMQHLGHKKTQNKKCDSLDFLNGSSYTMKTLRHSFPFLCHFHHAPSIQHAIAEKVIELESHAIPSPLVNFVMELVSLRS